MIYSVETFPVSFGTGIEGVHGTWYRKGNLMIVDTFKDIKLSEAFDVSALPEPMPSGYKGKELSRHINISAIGDLLQTIRLTRVLEIEGWASSAVPTDHMGRLELEPVEVNETEELRQLVKEEVDKAVKSMLKYLVDRMEGR